MEHAAKVFVRLVRVLMGQDAVADTKVAWGRELTVLGLHIQLTEKGIRTYPEQAKVSKWIQCIEKVLAAGKLAPGLASKISGKLAWGGSHLFARLGRAALRPLYDQRTRRDGKMSAELREALVWWLRVLRSDVAQLKMWSTPVWHVVHLFCDASSSPPHLGCVLFQRGSSSVKWCHMPVPKHVLENFRNRRDAQIMGLELLAISLGLSTFAMFLEQKMVVVHCDNRGSEVRCLQVSCHKEFCILVIVGCAAWVSQVP